MTYAIGDAKHRHRALRSDTDFLIVNHDGIKAIAAEAKSDPRVLDAFDTLIVDEATAFKNLSGKGGSSRARALADIRNRFEYRHLLTGTPAANSILDIWALAFLADDGERLGRSFYSFRNQVTTAKQVGPTANMVIWEERPGALEVVYKQLEDITLRFRKADCLDIPPNNTFTMYTQLPPVVMRAYEQMRRHSLIELESGTVATAVHAGVRAQKLLQICSGALYDSEGNEQIIALERYNLMADLVAEREWPCIIAFTWSHQRDQIQEALRRQGLSYCTIDGDTPQRQRADLVDRFQRGQFRAILLHPQSAAHGLTLTAARTTIWPSPTNNAEWFIQLNARADRAGQEHETETILIAAQNTRETYVYENILNPKVNRVQALLEMFA